MRNPFRSILFVFATVSCIAMAFLVRATESKVEDQNAELRKIRESMLPVRASYRIADYCVLVLTNYSTNSLSLTVTAIKEEFPRTNSIHVDLDASAAKELDFLEDWILTPEDRIRVEISDASNKYSRIWIVDCRTPSRKIAERQEAIFATFNQSKDQAENDSNGQTLSFLWRAGLLNDEIKEQLMQKHYRIVLQQISSRDGVPSWVVHSSLTFPFPNVYTAFTPTLYLNDQVKWSPGEPQTLCAMNATNNPITSMTGGVFKNGDALQCKIDLSQTVNGKVWSNSLWSNKIVLQGLSH